MLHAPTPRSLQELIDSKPNLVEFFRNDTLAPHAKDRHRLSPVPVEVTNWRDEQSDVAKLLIPYSPTEMAETLAAHRQADSTNNIRNIHLFPLGGIEAAATWIARNRSPEA